MFVDHVFVGNGKVTVGSVDKARIGLGSNTSMVTRMSISPQVRTVEIIVVAICFFSLQLISSCPYT